MKLAQLLTAVAATALIGGAAHAQQTTTTTTTTVAAPMPMPAPAATIGAATSTSVTTTDASGASVTNTLTTNGPVADTPENRAKYGQPMSHAGKRTAPKGN